MLDPEFFSPAFLTKKIVEVKNRTLSGPIFLEELDGDITEEMLTPMGNLFCKHYFSLDNSFTYMHDFCRTFEVGQMPADMYVIADTWANYSRMATRIDAAFHAMSDFFNSELSK